MIPAPTLTSNGTTLLTQLAHAKRVPVSFLRELGLHDLDGGRAVGIPYYGETGEDIAVKRRTALKATEGSYWPKGKPLAAYGLWRLDRANKAGFLLLVEGESDCWTLWHYGVPALGIPGASSAKVLDAEHLSCIEKVYIHREPDRGGETFVAGVLDRLGRLGFKGRVFKLQMPDGVKDPADLHVQDPERFLERIRAAILGSAPIEVTERNGSFESCDEWEPPILLAEMPAVQPFPIDVLPTCLGAFVRDGAAALACPVDYIGVPLVTLAGAAIGASRALEIKCGWQERPSLYAAIVAPPGSAKSPALKLVASPFYAEQARRMDHYRRQRLNYEEAEDGSVPRPILSTVYVADITTEALAGVLRDNRRGVAIIRDELTAWVAALDQYRAKGHGADRQFFLATWSGEPVRVDRKNQEDGPVFVSHPFVSVTGCIPPSLLSRLRSEKGIVDGFLDRLLFAYPDPLPAVGESWASIAESGKNAWKDALSFLWALQQEDDYEFGKRPHYIRLDASGREAWVSFTNALAWEMNADSFPDFLRGPWAKMKGYCARLALIVHCLRLATGEEQVEDVNAESLERGVVLVRYFQSHAHKVYAALDVDTEIDDAQRVLDWICRERPTEFKRYSVFEDVKNKRFSRIEDLDKPLERLEKHRILRREELPKGKGRPPDPVWVVNPLLFGNHPKNPINPKNSATK